MASTIGIKIANGEFYPVLEEDSEIKKRLVLTTVHDKQRSVQIDLYKSLSRTMADAIYIGSLVVEKIKARSRGEPSIELIMSSTHDGEINADAVDMDVSAQGERHTLSVSLKSFEDDDQEYDISDFEPDFEIDPNEQVPPGLFERATEMREEKHRFPWLLVICVALILTAIGLALWLFLFRDIGVEAYASARPASQAAQSSAPAPLPPAELPASAQPPPAELPASAQPPEAQPPPAQQPEAQAPPAAAELPASAPDPQPPPPPAIQAPAPAPVASYQVPSVIPREGVPYMIRYGDTLWGIADLFYRNPWLYPRIAMFNNIRNPDRIISGTTIRVPPRN